MAGACFENFESTCLVFVAIRRRYSVDIEQGYNQTGICSIDLLFTINTGIINQYRIPYRRDESGCVNDVFFQRR